MPIAKHLQAIMLLIICIPMLQVYSQPDTLVLRDTTIASAGDFVARNCIIAGPNFTIAGTGDATLRTGGYIYFRPRIAVIQGGKLRTILDTTLTSVRTLEAPLPATFNLQQNYPNPFNPSTNIRFAVKEKAHVRLVVYNLMGQSVATLVDKELPAGEYETHFSPSGLGSGVYVYRVMTNSFVQSKRMLYVK